MNPRSSASSSQDAGIGRNASLPHTAKRGITTNLKTTELQNIKLHGTPTTKELKKHSSRPIGGAEMGNRVGREDPRKAADCEEGLASWMTRKLKTQKL